MSGNTITKNCQVCGQPQTVQSLPDWLPTISGDILCDECDRKITAAAQAEARRIATEATKERTGIPARYHAFDAARDPHGLLSWLLERHHSNVLLSGPNGAGKTHAMSHAALRHSIQGVMNVRWLFFPSWIGEVCASMGTDGDAAQKAIRSAERAGLLVIDDLGKEKATPRSGEVLFCLLDCRIREGRPTWITTNFNGEEIAAKYGPDHGPAILSRLRREDFKTFEWGVK